MDSINLMIIPAILIVLSILTVVFSDQTIEQTECFDNKGNKIIDLVCEEKVYSPFNETLIWGLMAAALISAFMIAFYGWFIEERNY